MLIYFHKISRNMSILCLFRAFGGGGAWALNLPLPQDPLVAVTVRFQVTSLSHGLVELVSSSWTCVITRQTPWRQMWVTFFATAHGNWKGYGGVIGGTVKRITRYESLRRPDMGVIFSKWLGCPHLCPVQWHTLKFHLTPFLPLGFLPLRFGNSGKGKQYLMYLTLT